MGLVFVRFGEEDRRKRESCVLTKRTWYADTCVRSWGFHTVTTSLSYWLYRRAPTCTGVHGGPQGSILGVANWGVLAFCPYCDCSLRCPIFDCAYIHIPTYVPTSLTRALALLSHPVSKVDQDHRRQMAGTPLLQVHLSPPAYVCLVQSQKDGTCTQMTPTPPPHLAF